MPLSLWKKWYIVVGFSRQQECALKNLATWRETKQAYSSALSSDGNKSLIRCTATVLLHFCSRRDDEKRKQYYVTSTEGSLSTNGYAVIQHVILYRHLLDIIVSLQIMKIQRCVANRRCQFIRFATTNQELSRLLLVLHENIL